MFVKRLKIYSSLHDVGKVGISDNILKKQGTYTEKEFEEMKKHVIIGAKMLDSPEIDIMAKNIALYHHEKWNGTGYIAGLKGENIPLEARIVAIADVYDALTTRRIYRDRLPEKTADEIIHSSSGLHFDPKLVNIFFKNKKRILEINKNFKNGTSQ